jgi:hypothetical protein
VLVFASEVKRGQPFFCGRIRAGSRFQQQIDESRITKVDGSGIVQWSKPITADVVDVGTARNQQCCHSRSFPSTARSSAVLPSRSHGSSIAAPRSSSLRNRGAPSGTHGCDQRVIETVAGIAQSLKHVRVSDFCCYLQRGPKALTTAGRTPRFGTMGEQ